MIKINKSYQEFSKIILKEILDNELDLRNIDHQKYFYDLKKKYPENYKHLIFDTNAHKPFSKDLESILTDFKIAGYVGFDNFITQEQREMMYKDLNKGE